MSWRKCRKKQNFSVPIKNDATNIHKDDGNESVVTIYYKTKLFVNSARFTERSLSNFADNLAKGIHKVKFEACNCFLEFEIIKDNLIKI